MMIKPKLNSALKTKVISIIPSVVHTIDSSASHCGHLQIQ